MPPNDISVLHSRVNGVRLELASHVAECGQLRKKTSESLDLANRKLDIYGEQLATINTSLAVMAGTRSTKQEIDSRTLKLLGLVAAISAAVATAVQTFF